MEPFPSVMNHKAGEKSSSDAHLITTYIDVLPQPALITTETDVNARVQEESACSQRS